MSITFDLKKKSSRSQKGETVEEYLKRRKSVDTYVDIMTRVEPSNPAFQTDFSEFYGLNEARGMNKTAFYKIFDEYYNHKNNKYVSYRNILNDLKSPSGTGRIETSFGSKLLHTIDCDEPIYDNEVIEKLRSCFGTERYFRGVPKIINSIDDAVAVYNALRACYYDCLIPYAKKVGYFDAFDSAFPFAKHISEVKKIDFYLWAM